MKLSTSEEAWTLWAGCRQTPYMRNAFHKAQSSTWLETNCNKFSKYAAEGVEKGNIEWAAAMYDLAIGFRLELVARA
jgi:hypothetical protein